MFSEQRDNVNKEGTCRMINNVNDNVVVPTQVFSIDFSNVTLSWTYPDTTYIKHAAIMTKLLMWKSNFNVWNCQFNVNVIYYRPPY